MQGLGQQSEKEEQKPQENCEQKHPSALDPECQHISQNTDAAQLSEQWGTPGK